MALAIETHKLTVHFNDECAVNGIELAVERQHLWFRWNGKSTTMKMLTGLLAPSGGQMFVLGREYVHPTRCRKAKCRTGNIPRNGRSIT